VNFCALFVIILGQSIIPAIMLGAGVIIIAGLTIYVIKKYYSSKNRKRKTNLDIGLVTYDCIFF